MEHEHGFWNEFNAFDGTIFYFRNTKKIYEYSRSYFEGIHNHAHIQTYLLDTIHYLLNIECDFAMLCEFLMTLFPFFIIAELLFEKLLGRWKIVGFDCILEILRNMFIF